LGLQPTTPKTGGIQMVKRRKNNTKKKRNGKGFKENRAKARKIDASTVYVDSLGINQANAFLKITSSLRERVWQLCEIEYYRIRTSIDTTVETIFGNQQGGRKGHIPNTVVKRQFLRPNSKPTMPTFKLSCRPITSGVI
jgi:hypothetical protein